MLEERGYLIPAVNTDTVDYVNCARQLARSIHRLHPGARVCLLTDTAVEESDFDIVRTLPSGNLGGFDNDWQVFRASPFRQTIKLEADMIAASPIDHWWTLFEHRDVVVSQGSRDFYDQPATSRRYRKLFDDNNLPDVYNAITYWRLSTTAQEFFEWVRRIFENWAQYRTLLKFPDDTATTDVVYAMAAQIMGPERVTLPPGVGPNIVHMKRYINPIHTDDWTRELVWEHTDPGVRINTVAQWGMFHYHVKNWL
jgi:hypothetical protein